MTPPLRGDVASYWEKSRSHRYSLLFVLPLLLLYELLMLVAPVRADGGVIRNGADVILTSLFSALFGVRGPMVFMAIVIGVSLYLIQRDKNAGPLRPGIFGAMFAESVVLAMAFGLVIGLATMQLVGPLARLAGGGIAEGTVLERLTLSLGAGLYEELLFRVILVALLANGFRLLGAKRLTAGVAATLIGAVLFSAFHYIGAMGDPLRLDSFVFRALAGVAFSAMYLTRGFGITAWTHAIYDIAVLL